MEKRFDRIEQKLDLMDEKLDKVVLTTAQQAMEITRNTDDLERHMRRTEQNEVMISLNRDSNIKLTSYLKTFHVLLGIATAIGGLIIAAMRLF